MKLVFERVHKQRDSRSTEFIAREVTEDGRGDGPRLRVYLQRATGKHYFRVADKSTYPKKYRQLFFTETQEADLKAFDEATTDA